jgi:hypothetical protein
VGDTVLTYKAPKLHTPPAKAPDLSKLKNNDDPDLKGKPLRMVAIGGSLTAGVRDGGYFNEGMLTSYPNLIARQMGIKFEQPLFDGDSYNGYGRKVRTSFNPTGGPVPKFKSVSNNSGVESVENGYLKPKKYKGNLDNFSVPELEEKAFKFKYYLQDAKLSKTNLGQNLHERLINNSSEKMGDIFFKNKFDFVIIQMGWSAILSEMYAPTGLRLEITDQDYVENKYAPAYRPDVLTNFDAYINAYGYKLSSAFIYAAESRRLKVKKGVILNTPDIFSFPYYKNIISIDLVKSIYSMVAENFDNEIDVFTPNSSTDSLVSPKVNIMIKPGLKGNKVPLQENSFFKKKDKYNNYLRELNEEKVYISKKFDYPLVDLYSIYNTILAGKYITDDGVRIDSAYPNGNFFSSDGINPTAFGQAVIANEVIKVLNASYKTEIPLIKTAEYLR